MDIPRGSRPSIDEYFLRMASLVATRSTCIRRQVGCVLANVHNHVIATGYNGVCKGDTHCIASPCPGAFMPSGEGLHLCQAIHAEQNALIQCRDIDAIHTAYCTASPCVNCMRLLVGTGVQRIVFRQTYPHPEPLLMASARSIEWVHVP